MNPKSKSVGIVKTQSATFDQELKLESGQKLGPITLAYETYGVLNQSKTNAILVCHAFSGDAHAAGFHEGAKDPGWWDALIGPGKALDTEKYFIICINCIGGCKGSTGPSSINPKTGKPYALNFPLITIADMVDSQKLLIDYLGIKKLLCVIGGSMGGMQALHWVTAYPDAVQSAIPIATALKHSPQQIAFDEVGRQAIMADPYWNNGDYYDKKHPEKGLAVARMIGHITYMSDVSMEEKFSRRLKGDDYSFKFTADFEVEGYLRHRGDTFVKRFDANSYLYITKAMDYFDLSGGKFLSSKRHVDVRFLVIAFKSDWLYPAYQSQDIIRQLKIQGLDATYCEINSTYGHDSFLLEIDEESRLIKHFLDKTFRGYDIRT
ncbi:MAG TPA: homoserine O-acetyltransferase [Candidatus Omnitrophota bacterium]|nr:homoserine O-acetyltransferase [Candidatus Omnitrophota bacterium]HPT08028.1 homoserine O-acetyltransferase [Candidatus Omnitrophota bacterium]